jgi:hypothetical protein
LRASKAGQAAAPRYFRPNGSNSISKIAAIGSPSIFRRWYGVRWAFGSGSQGSWFTRFDRGIFHPFEVTSTRGIFENGNGHACPRAAFASVKTPEVVKAHAPRAHGAMFKRFFLCALAALTAGALLAAIIAVETAFYL